MMTEIRLNTSREKVLESYSLLKVSNRQSISSLYCCFCASLINEASIHSVHLFLYLASNRPTPVSLTLPLRTEEYRSNVLFSFFDGLIPEGWMLNIAERNWKINRRDRMGLLLSCCRDCIGDVSIVPIERKEEAR